MVDLFFEITIYSNADLLDEFCAAVWLRLNFGESSIPIRGGKGKSLLAQCSGNKHNQIIIKEASERFHDRKFPERGVTVFLRNTDLKIEVEINDSRFRIIQSDVFVSSECGFKVKYQQKFPELEYF